jgi:two-component system, NtrC family, C4-dicarboxylate transport sensor histidine kinase DctB
VALLTLVGLIVTILVSDHYAKSRAVAALGQEAEASSELLASALTRELEKYRLASLVLAQDADALRILQAGNVQDRDAFNVKLEDLSQEMGAAALYLLNVDGTTVAASNWRTPQSFVDQNYQFRPYFRQAIATGSFEQFALGTVSRRPGLYIARRLQRGGKTLGVIIAKVEFDALEAEWRSAGISAFATNPDGVVLVTSDAAIRFKTIRPLDGAAQSKMLRDLDYGSRPLEMLPLFAKQDVALAGNPTAATKSTIQATETLQNGWVLHILKPTSPAIQPALLASRLTAFVTILVAAVLATLIYYLRWSAAYRAEKALNERQRELNERLVQLNKLATLGQIAAGVGHEINQPLSGISAYAHNALTLLDRGDTGAVHENLGLIGKLAARIGAITGELRGFARKATGSIVAVSVAEVIQGALLLLRDRINSAEATVNLPKADALVLVEGVRLEQVLVNLIQNALDAQPEGLALDLVLTSTETFVELTVADNGPGLTEAARVSLFQPFSTTKREGLGLGLVISRDIMSDFGGELAALAPPKGAAFVLRMKPAS